MGPSDISEQSRPRPAPSPHRRHVVERRRRFNRKTPRWWECKGCELFGYPSCYQSAAGGVSWLDARTAARTAPHTGQLTSAQTEWCAGQNGAPRRTRRQRRPSRGACWRAPTRKPAEGCVAAWVQLHEEQPTGLPVGAASAASRRQRSWRTHGARCAGTRLKQKFFKKRLLDSPAVPGYKLKTHFRHRRCSIGRHVRSGKDLRRQLFSLLFFRGNNYFADFSSLRIGRYTNVVQQGLNTSPHMSYIRIPSYL